eukprot:8325125-Pyramimonas_sp.AAC.1
MNRGDLHAFYALLPKLSIHVRGRSRQGEEPHTLEQIADFLESLGSNPAVVTEETIARGCPEVAVDPTLGDTPSAEEVLRALRKMKDSAAGSDEISVGLFKVLGPRGQNLLVRSVWYLWDLPPGVWPAEVADVVGFRLFKKGDRGNLGNYRTLWLINVI